MRAKHREKSESFCILRSKCHSDCRCTCILNSIGGLRANRKRQRRRKSVNKWTVCVPNVQLGSQLSLWCLSRSLLNFTRAAFNYEIAFPFCFPRTEVLTWAHRQMSAFFRERTRRAQSAFTKRRGTDASPHILSIKSNWVERQFRPYARKWMESKRRES